MATNLFTSETKFLERARTALTTAQESSNIKSALLEYGLTEEQLAEGWKIYMNAVNVFELSEDPSLDDKDTAKFKENYLDLQAIYKKHRDQVLIFYKKQPEMLMSLGVVGSFPVLYEAFLDKVHRFYGEIHANSEIQAEVRKLKITPKVAEECFLKFEKIHKEKANFTNELLELEDVTKNKNAAFLTLNDWMEDFDIISKVALYNNPQLLEGLGIFVRA